MGGAGGVESLGLTETPLGGAGGLESLGVHEARVEGGGGEDPWPWCI